MVTTVKKYTKLFYLYNPYDGWIDENVIQL
jgi:hypothetical protein